MSLRPAVSRDRWLVSYADFMTLLCAFFTTLYAASLVNPAPVARPAAAAPSAPITTSAAPIVAPPADDLVRGRLEAALGDDLSAGRVTLVEDPRGLVIAIPEVAAFEPGRATLSPVALGMMQRLAAVLADVPNAVRVEGHTDDRPIASTRFQSNWDLSTARATAVVAVFIGGGGLAPERLSAAGYSQFKPRASNASADGRAQNRRVDIVVLNAGTASREEPAPEATR